MVQNHAIDVIIVGGSYAGLSAAMALGRSLKNVLVIDSGKPCNRYTPHSHNFITHDGSVPADIAAKAKEQVLKYKTVKFYDDLAVHGFKTEKGFDIHTHSGEIFSAKKLIFATGVKDIFPDIEGFEACWGKSVIHCPYCHGYEVRGKKTAIVANGERAVHLTSLVNNLSQHITIIPGGKPEFTEEQLDKLGKHKIRVIEKEVREILHENGQITSLVFKDNTLENFDAAYAAIPFEQHCDIPINLGCELTEMGHLQVDAFQKTTVAGVYACGDNTSPMRSVSNAVAAGTLVGAMVNSELTQEMF
ncbi:NAD(P)/FAD-dependent oxidoreductase [Sphingobacterium gobiense]|uniref:Pyridine nucleotide-disulfide oxidoreductase n=1 Tax=Sphingobacterium gobiense TaxID=1382456 RepID=A0A2S9JV00_9SPHI|nr:NAD(P)/FAD-dependent oxidoreductase [Sphingobacterium gobiense]PRD57114.1 pyridine nucleotide-disulfide oxidoreductase [Sphingobacterium gobiense]